MKVQNNIRVGKPEADVSAAAHTHGIREGNAKGSYEDAKGHLANGKSTAARSTGINPENREPIDPRMPNLSPA